MKSQNCHVRKDSSSSVSNLMRELQWETSQERRRIQRLTFMYKMPNGQEAVPVELIDLELSSDFALYKMLLIIIIIIIITICTYQPRRL